MEYLTVRETAEKWGVTIRQVQNLCKERKVKGAIRFSRAWAIPKDAEKPGNVRCKANERSEIKWNSGENKELHEKIVEFLPFPIMVFSKAGTLNLVNEAWEKVFHIPQRDKFIGRYNVLHDTDLEKWGVKDYILKAYQGETIQLYDMKVPMQDMMDSYGEGKVFLDSIFQNITCIPIYDTDHQLSHVVTVFITSKMYSGKKEIVKIKEYIENHWQEEFDIDEVASRVNLSKYHLARLFKKHTGMTLYGYYQDIKINKIKEKLCDKNLSISQAFAHCGVNYNGNFAKIFKEKVGMTPSQYQMLVTKK